jgi:hypothetical protein
MLNISDIRNRLEKNPEPHEVKEIREKIKKKFSNLEFIEDGHKYFLKSDGKIKEMESVTKLAQTFEEHVDWELVLERKAAKLGIGTEALRREWKERNITSTSNGTLTHLFAEAYMYFFMGDIDSIPYIIREMQYEDGFLIPYGNKQKAVAKYYEDLYNVSNFYPVMPEAQIYIDADDNPYHMNINAAGTFDALFAYKSNGKFYLSVRDWKTNKSLENEYNQNNNNMLLTPFSHLVNEPRNVYTIQLGLYQLGIEQLGYEVKDRKLLWLTDDAEYHKIDVPDITEKLKLNFIA